MKVLFLSPYVYDPNLKEFSKNKTGFGMMVKDIFDQVSQTEQATMVTHVLTNGHERLQKHTLFQVLGYAKPKEWFDACIAFVQKKGSIASRLKQAYYTLDKGYLRYVISDFSPDIIHLHGLDEGCVRYLEICEKSKIPYLITLHGLIKNDSYASKNDRAIERTYLKRFEKNGNTVSVISTGIRDKLQKDSYYDIKRIDNTTVITNGIDIHPRNAVLDIRNEYGIPASAKIVLSVGSVSHIKNQLQVVRAYNKLPEDLKMNLWVILIGTINQNYPIREEVNKNDNAMHILLTGFVPHEFLSSYYSEADLVVLASKSEGFGLSLVEGFVYGVPSVTFADLDAVPDLYNENAMMLCTERTDEALANTMAAALKKEWNHEWIREYSKRFSLEHMGNRYLDLYQSVLEKARRHDG